MRDGAIFAVKFDPRAIEVSGNAVPVRDDVAWEPTGGLGGFAVSSNGTLVYVRASAWNVDRRLAWIDRAGVETPVLSQPGAYAEPRLSPDGRWIAVTIASPKRDIWLYELARGILTRLTRANSAAFSPVWMPDSRAIVYTHEDPVYDVNRIPIDGSATTRAIIRTPWDKIPSSISPDGRMAAYSENRSGLSILAVPLDGSARPKRLTSSDANQQRPMFSPTGGWIAYEEETGDRGNVYLSSADGSGGRRQVSPDGGSEPRWTRGGREIVYRRGEAMLAVAVNPGTGEIGRPVELFRRRQFDLDLASVGYDVTPDGNRFLLAVPVESPGVQPFVVVLNWLEELRGKTGQ
jgi:hypothetical protein